MILCLCEKPAIGQAIDQALPGKGTSKNGCIYNGDYTIAWAFGHLLGLKEPEDYSEDYKKWDLNQLPIYFENWGQKIGKDSNKKPGMITKSQKVKQIGELLKQADMVIHAGDPDEEGQLLIDELLRWFRYKGPVKRLETANLTKGAMTKALNHLTDNKKQENAGWSAHARSVADLMVGVNMSRYFTCKNQILLTVGRVQTPTLGLVVNRDAIIENHVKTVFYELFADTAIDGKTITCKWIPNKNDPNLNDGKILDKSILEQKINSLNQKEISGIQIKKTMAKEEAPLPFNLVKLQSYCGTHFGFDPTDTMNITQSLREKHKAITYNRSDCQYLSEEHYKEAPGVINAVLRNLSYDNPLLDSKRKSKCFNDANITAHHAIIPTNTNVNLDALSDSEKKVYLAICKYYLAQFLPPAEKEKTKLHADLSNGEVLEANSVAVIKPGYLELLKETKKDEETNELSSCKEGIYSGKIENAEIKEKETKPPSRYTTTSLNEDMTRIAKYVQDPKIKALLLEKDKDKKGENGSIGTSATRGLIIDNLLRRGFLEKKGKTVISTPLGRELYRILPDEIKKPDMTAKWWVIQEDIKNGAKTYDALPTDVLKTIKTILQTDYPPINRAVLPVGSKGGAAKVIGKCPKCGADVIATAKGFFCQKKECDFALWPTMKYFDNTLKITAAKATALLSGKHASFKLKSKTGKDYDGYLKMKLNGKYVNFEPDGFPPKKQTRKKK